MMPTISWRLLINSLLCCIVIASLTSVPTFSQTLDSSEAMKTTTLVRVAPEKWHHLAEQHHNESVFKCAPELAKTQLGSSNVDAWQNGTKLANRLGSGCANDNFLTIEVNSTQLGQLSASESRPTAAFSQLEPPDNKRARMRHPHKLNLISILNANNNKPVKPKLSSKSRKFLKQIQDKRKLLATKALWVDQANQYRGSNLTVSGTRQHSKWARLGEQGAELATRRHHEAGAQALGADASNREGRQAGEPEQEQQSRSEPPTESQGPVASRRAPTTIGEATKRAKAVVSSDKSGQADSLPAKLRQRIIEQFIKNGGSPQDIVVSDSTITTTSQSKKKTITTIYKIVPSSAAKMAQAGGQRPATDDKNGARWPGDEHKQIGPETEALGHLGAGGDKESGHAFGIVPPIGEPLKSIDNQLDKQKFERRPKRLKRIMVTRIELPPGSFMSDNNDHDHHHQQRQGKDKHANREDLGAFYRGPHETIFGMDRNAHKFSKAQRKDIADLDEIVHQMGARESDDDHDTGTGAPAEAAQHKGGSQSGDKLADESPATGKLKKASAGTARHALPNVAGQQSDDDDDDDDNQEPTGGADKGAGEPARHSGGAHQDEQPGAREPAPTTTRAPPAGLQADTDKRAPGAGSDGRATRPASAQAAPNDTGPTGPRDEPARARRQRRPQSGSGQRGPTGQADRKLPEGARGDWGSSGKRDSLEELKRVVLAQGSERTKQLSGAGRSPAESGAKSGGPSQAQTVARATTTGATAHATSSTTPPPTTTSTTKAPAPSEPTGAARLAERQQTGGGAKPAAPAPGQPRTTTQTPKLVAAKLPPAPVPTGAPPANTSGPGQQTGAKTHNIMMLIDFGSPGVEPGVGANEGLPSGRLESQASDRSREAAPRQPAPGFSAAHSPGPGRSLGNQWRPLEPAKHHHQTPTVSVQIFNHHLGPAALGDGGLVGAASRALGAELAGPADGAPDDDDDEGGAPDGWIFGMPAASQQRAAPSIAAAPIRGAPVEAGFEPAPRAQAESPPFIFASGRAGQMAPLARQVAAGARHSAQTILPSESAQTNQLVQRVIDELESSAPAVDYLDEHQAMGELADEASVSQLSRLGHVGQLGHSGHLGGAFTATQASGTIGHEGEHDDEHDGPANAQQVSGAGQHLARRAGPQRKRAASLAS